MSTRQPLLNVNLPAPDFDEAARVGHTLAVSLPKGPLQIGRFNLPPFGVSEHFQRRVLPIIAAMMRSVRQPVVIADQFAMKFNCFIDRFASLPVVLSESSLNTELALNQVLLGMALFIHVVMDAEPFIDADPIVIIELTTVVGNRLCPKSPA